MKKPQPDSLQPSPDWALEPLRDVPKVTPLTPLARAEPLAVDAPPVVAPTRPTRVPVESANDSHHPAAPVETVKTEATATIIGSRGQPLTTSPSGSADLWSSFAAELERVTGGSAAVDAPAVLSSSPEPAAVTSPPAELPDIPLFDAEAPVETSRVTSSLHLDLEHLALEAEAVAAAVPPPPVNVADTPPPAVRDDWAIEALPEEEQWRRTEAPEPSGNNISERQAFDQMAMAVDVVPSRQRPQRRTGPAREPMLYPFEFVGSGVDYAKIWLPNLLLTLITLGLWSPWAKVRGEQYLHGATRLAGASFSYRGSPWAIARGRLVLLALAGAGAACWWWPVAAVPVALVIVPLLPLLLQSGLQFRLAASSWRNCHFDFVGSYGKAFQTFYGSLLVTLLSGGLALPLAYCWLARYAINHASLGGDIFRCHLRLSSLYWLAGKVALLVGFGLAAIAGVALLFPHQAPWLLLPLALQAYTLWRSGSRNLLFNQSSLDDARLVSSVTSASLLLLYLSNLFMLAVTGGLAWPWVAVRTARYYASRTEVAATDLDGFVLSGHH
ncbi:MAG: DUF898 family protein [Gammaproteobacteria bacterium]|nr:DUF898 family protein [Gammaproteobacteria bacterium]